MKNILDQKSLNLKHKDTRSRFEITNKIAFKEWSIDHSALNMSKVPGPKYDVNVKPTKKNAAVVTFPKYKRNSNDVIDKTTDCFIYPGPQSYDCLKG